MSPVTIEHAYSLLCDEGYIESRERSGYFVIFRTSDDFEGSPDTCEKALLVSPCFPDKNSAQEFPFSVLAKTMRSVITDFGENILQRCDNKGCMQLREEIRKYLMRSRGINAQAKQIVIGSGSEYLYRILIETFGRDKRYAIESPSYKKIEQVYRSAEVDYDMLSLDTDGINSKELQMCDADILHISPYRSYPSGVTASASKRYEYLRWVNQKNRYIIEDDFESEISVSKKHEESLYSLSDGTSTGNNVIYMNTFSITISPSFRVGYMVLPSKLVKTFDEKAGFYSCTVPTYIQYVLASLIASGDFERHINRVRRKKRKDLSLQ